MKKTKFMLTSILTTLATPVLAVETAVKTTPYTDQTVETILTNIITWLLNIAGGVAVLFIIYGGILYMTANGSKDRADAAKKTLTYAVIGLVFVILSRFIVAFVEHNLTTTGGPII